MNINMSAKRIKVYVKLINYVWATLYQIAIPYDSKVVIWNEKLETILSYWGKKRFY